MLESIPQAAINITVNTKDLNHALNFANSVVEKRNILSALSNIKLVAKGAVLEIGATDMDLYLHQEIGAEVMTEGETTVSTQLLSEVVRKISDEQITMIQMVDSNELEIIGKKCKFKLLTLPAANFPEMENIDAESSLKISCSALLEIIESTNFSMSNDETRYNLNGLYLHIRDGKLYSASTDGHRLSLACTRVDNGADDIGVIIPKKTIIELNKLIKDSKNINSDIELHISSTKLQFQCNNIILISKLIDGTFPDYTAFIPVDNENKLIISNNSLANSIDRIATVTVEKFRAIKFFLYQDRLKITATGEAKGIGDEELAYEDGDSYHGEEMAIGFNPKYLSDILSAIKDEYVEMYFKDSVSPILIKTESNPDNHFVVMPVKV